MDRKWFPDFIRVVDEFEYTGEEIVSLLERLCEIEWVEGEADDSDEEEEEEEEEEQEEEL